MTGAVGRRVRRWAAVLALASVATASACSPAVDPSPSEPSGVPADGRTATPTAAPTPATPRRHRPDRVSIAVAGDIHFEGVLARGLRRPATALRPATTALAAADLAIANLETSVGAGGRPEPGKRFTFSAGPAAFAALAAAGIDVASMANNHALDFGRARLRSTLRAAGAARPALSVVGIGADEDAAFAPAVADLGGTLVATLAASVADQDPTADPTGAWAAGPDRAGVADAIDPRRLLAEVRRADASA
ncbi:MAG TPA: CapA family protein, partial [Nocardioides sp.]|nr:CapA family protein [Nocardioides sp.]